MAVGEQPSKLDLEAVPGAGTARRGRLRVSTRDNRNPDQNHEKPYLAGTQSEAPQCLSPSVRNAIKPPNLRSCEKSGNLGTFLPLVTLQSMKRVRFYRVHKEILEANGQ